MPDYRRRKALQQFNFYREGHEGWLLVLPSASSVVKTKCRDYRQRKALQQFNFYREGHEGWLLVLPSAYLCVLCGENKGPDYRRRKACKNLIFTAKDTKDGSCFFPLRTLW